MSSTEIAPEGAWVKSSHSDGTGNACVEVVNLSSSGHVGIRDSKDKAGPALVVSYSAWAHFVTLCVPVYGTVTT